MYTNIMHIYIYIYIYIYRKRESMPTHILIEKFLG